MNKIKKRKVDILIKQAKIRFNEIDLFDLTIDNNQIIDISRKIDVDAETVLDADGGLISESFINPHLHLCKVYTLQQIGEDTLRDYHGSNMANAMSAIEKASIVKESYKEDWIVKNVRKALAKAIYYGCTHIRAFADIDEKAKLEGVKALLKVKKEFKNIVDIQVVAFPQDGIIRHPAAKNLMREAMSLDVDVVGGIPWIEYTNEDIFDHVNFVFNLAQEFNKDVSMLVDDAGDPGLRSLEVMAVETIRRKWFGRSLAHHARAMAMYPTPYLNKVIALMKSGKVGLVTDPHTGPLHAKVSKLLKENILICLGQDDISDAYYPFGRNNMLEVAFLVSHILWFTTKELIEKLYDMITTFPAQAIGIKNHSLQKGSPANLVVLNQSNVLEAFRFHEAPKYVISHGKIIDQENYKKQFLLY